MTLETLFILILISIASNILANDIDPLQWIKNKLGVGPRRELKSDYFIVDTIAYSIWKLLNCNSCLAYWITFVFFLPALDGLYLGLISYALSAWLYKSVFSTSIDI